MFIFLNKLSEDTASIFKSTLLTLGHKNDYRFKKNCLYLDYMNIKIIEYIKILNI